MSGRGTRLAVPMGGGDIMALKLMTASAMIQSGIASLGMARGTGLLRGWSMLRFETGPYFMFTAAVELRRTERAGLLLLGGTAIVGLVIINMYNVWEWNLYIVITLTGWLAFLKGGFYLLAPGSWIKRAMKCKLVRQEGFLYFWGVLITVLGVLLTYNAYWA